MTLDRIYRCLLVLGLLACGAACSSAPPGGTGPLSSGTPQTGESFGAEPPAGENLPPPSDLTDPPTLPPPACGNGVFETGEECDGSSLNGKSCATFGFSLGSLTCTAGCTLDTGGCSNPPPAPTCGNGKPDAGEVCDDGNITSGDGCRADCQKLEVCGDVIVDAGEQCDDGNALNWDGCSPTCQTEVAPTILDNFATPTNTAWTAKNPHGSVTFAVADPLASDQKSAKLVFSGGQSNAAGPGSSTQIATKSLLGFGMYRARFNFAKCNAGEDLMNGIFVYSYGGTNGLPVDSNSNGITDNNEIDIELLCATPKKLYLTSWTDYDYDTPTGTETIKKITRVIDLSTGKAYETPPGKEGTYDVDYATVKQTIPEMALPTLATDNAYYEMGFDWQSTSIRFFIVLKGQEVTLWNFANATYIPQNKAFMMFNLWYPAWSGKAYPVGDQSLNVDWFKYWAN